MKRLSFVLFVLLLAGCGIAALSNRPLLYNAALFVNNQDTQTFSIWTLQDSIVVTRVQLTLNAPMSGCSSLPKIQVWDGSTKIQEFSIVNGTAAYDSGAISYSANPGSELQVQLSNSSPGNKDCFQVFGNLLVEYR